MCLGVKMVKQKTITYLTLLWLKPKLINNKLDIKITQNDEIILIGEIDVWYKLDMCIPKHAVIA